MANDTSAPALTAEEIAAYTMLQAWKKRGSITDEELSGMWTMVRWENLRREKYGTIDARDTDNARLRNALREIGKLRAENASWDELWDIFSTASAIATRVLEGGKDE
jgi:hypothetical protein